jgi:hypothetical protein
MVGVSIDGSRTLSTELILVLVACGLGGFASGLAGFAFALVASALVVRVFDPVVSTPLVMAGSLIAQSLTLHSVLRGVNWRQLGPLLVGGLAGVPVGVLAITWIDPGAFRVSVGILLIAYPAWLLFAPMPATLRGGRGKDVAVGVAGGVMAGLASLSGPAVTLWCTLQRLPKDQARALYQPFIVVTHATGLIGFAATGTLSVEVGRWLLIAAPAILAGVLLGRRLYSVIDDQQFRRIILWLLLASGVSLVAGELW